MKVYYYILLSILSALCAFTFYGLLEGPSYSKFDTILWGTWFFSSLVTVIYLNVCKRGIFSMKKSKAAILISIATLVMLTVVDAVYWYHIITEDVILKYKINQSLLFLALICLTGGLVIFYRKNK